MRSLHVILSRDILGPNPFKVDSTRTLLQEQAMGFAGRKKAFLTGGGGYVGTRLAQYLEEHGYDVAVADIKFADATLGAENGRTRLRLEVGIYVPWLLSELLCAVPVNLSAPH